MLFPSKGQVTAVSPVALDRVVGDFRGADTNDAAFKVAFPRLLDALRKRIAAAAKSQDETIGKA
jgi:hypothetical protein